MLRNLEAAAMKKLDLVIPSSDGPPGRLISDMNEEADLSKPEQDSIGEKLAEALLRRNPVPLRRSLVCASERAYAYFALLS
jgi:hypothetical protein